MKKLLSLLLILGLFVSAGSAFAQTTGDPHNLGNYYSNEERNVLNPNQTNEQACWGFVFRPTFRPNGSLPANTQCLRVQVKADTFGALYCGVNESEKLNNEQCVVRAAAIAGVPTTRIPDFKKYATHQAICGTNSTCAAALENCIKDHATLGPTNLYNLDRVDECIAIKRSEYCQGANDCPAPGQSLSQLVSAAKNLCQVNNNEFGRSHITIPGGIDLGSDYIYSLGAGALAGETYDKSIAYVMYDSKGGSYTLDSTNLPPGQYRAGVWIKSRADFAAKKDAEPYQWVCNTRVLTVANTTELPKISPISAFLEENKATFNFSYSKGEDADFEVALGTSPDLRLGTYLRFANGTSSPLVTDDTKKMAQYSCGTPFWWKVSVRGADPAVESDIQGPVQFKCPADEQKPDMEDKFGFSDLSATLTENRAEFKFNSSRIGTYRIALGINPDLVNGTFITFAQGTEGPLVNDNPKDWNQYECNKDYYWQVWERDMNISNVTAAFIERKVFSEIRGPVRVSCMGQSTSGTGGTGELTNQQNSEITDQKTTTAESAKVKIYTQVGNQEREGNITIQTGQTFNIFAKLAHPLTNNQFVCLPTNGNITIKYGGGNEDFKTVKACEAFNLSPSREGDYNISALFTPQDDDPSVLEGSSQVSVTVVNPTVPVSETPTFQTCPDNVSACWKGAGCHNNPETQLSSNQVCNYNHPEENYQSTCSHIPTSNTYDDGCTKKVAVSEPTAPTVRSITINGQPVGLNDSLPLRLNGTSGQAQSFLIPVVVTYDNGTTKYLTLNFRYNPAQGGEEPAPVQNPSQPETCIYSEEPQNCSYGGSRECTGTWQGTALAKQCKYDASVDPKCTETCNNPPAAVEQPPAESTPSTCDPSSNGPEWEYRGCTSECPYERWYCSYDDIEHEFENTEGECACSK